MILLFIFYLCSGQRDEINHDNKRLLASTQIPCKFQENLRLAPETGLCYSGGCPDNQSFPLAVQLTNTSQVILCFSQPQPSYNCEPQCKGCYHYGPADCVECADAKNRGSGLDVTFQFISSFSRPMCKCNTGFVEYTPKAVNCLCPDGNFILVSSPTINYCSPCSAGCSMCTSKTSCQTCAVGEGRGTDPSTLCKCIEGYMEQTPPVNDCMLACQGPCKVCVTGSNTLCQNCIDSKMTLDTSKACNCPQKYYYSKYTNYICSDCHYSCKTCTGPSQSECLSCSPESLRTFTNNNCNCPLYYADVQGQEICISCHWTCQTCSSATTCDTCPIDSNRITNKSNICICKAGFANDLNSANCIKCLYSCATCGETYDQCLTCPSNSNRQLIDEQCKCSIRYYDNQASQCQPCHFSCLTCIDGQPSSCLTCDTSKKRQLQNGYCNCTSGYGYIDEYTEQCQACSQQCVTCSQVDICLSCNLLNKRVLSDDSKCPCDTYYIEINSNCQRCHYTCLSCLDLTKGGCINCDYDNGWIMKANNQCGCDDGYFESNKTCKQCYYQCLTCLNQYSDGCITCAPSRIRSDLTKFTSSCLCATQQYIDDGINMECQPCHYSCFTCSGGAYNNCLSCFDNSQIQSTISRQLKIGQCLCPFKWLDNEINERCVACHPSCERCFDTTEYSCLTCAQQEFRTQSINSCFCLEGYFEDQQYICQPCDYRCLTCKLDATNCLSCLDGSNRYLVSQDQNQQYQTCKCPVQFPNDKEGNPICQNCHFSCQNCLTSDINSCTLCDDNSFRYLSQDTNGSYCLCKQTYYDTGKVECSSCSNYCLGCSTNPDNCISCNQDDFRELKNNQCVCAARFGTQLLSYYESTPRDPTCLVCHFSCQTCNGPNYDNCLTCSDLDFREKASSQCLCKATYIEINERICQGCDYQCLTCQMVKSICTQCPPSSLRTLNPSTQSCDCPFGYYDNSSPLCEVCDINCETCTHTSVTCLSCKNNTNRYYNNLSFTCDCYQGYYDNLDGTCSKCHFSCISCIGPLSSDCVICPQFTVTQRWKSLNQCKCSDGYFDDGVNQICQQCSVTCLTCQSNQNYCLDCIDNQNRYLHQNQCICKDQYFDSGSSVCSQCNVKCQKCQLNADYCTQCDQQLKRQLNTINNFCDCEGGYYDNGNLICYQCNIKCQKCINSSDNCTACYPNSYRELISSSCQCIQGTLDTGLQQCLLCDKKCLTCENTISNCSSCDINLNRVLFENKCQCQYGYYENSNQICQICDQLCLECNSNNICTKCDQTQNRTLNYQGQCVCVNGYFEDSNQQCQMCSQNCLNCQNSENNCITCGSNRYLSNNKCLCVDGLYDDGNNCLSCDIKCQTCTLTSTNCLSCPLNSNRIFQNNTCICASGYWDQGTQNCVQCDQSCLTCSLDINTCSSCNTSLNRQLIDNQCKCIDGYYDSNNVCELCHYSCKTCNINSTQCTSCEISNSFRLDQSLGFNQCPCLPGFYDDGQLVCQKCSYKCLNCKISSDNCTACNINLGYFRLNLIPQCECQAGYFDDGIQVICQKCSNKCQTCILDQQNCTLCESQIKRQSAPLCDCKDGYFDMNQFCLQCQANCLTCIQNSSNCLSCQPDRIGKKCLCSEGYYEMYAQTCYLCNYKCATCAQDQLNCLSCKGDRMNPPNCVCSDHYYDDFVQQNCQPCNQNCGKCDINGCIDCQANRILNNKQCDCPINSISYNDTPYCSNCDVAVVNGYFSDDLTKIQIQFEYPLLYNFDFMVSKEEYCSKLILNGTLIKLGQNPQCQIDNNILNIQLGDGAKINVGDTVQFNSTQLKHDNCLNPLLLIIRTNIKPPQNLIKPEVQLQYPSQVSPCQIIEILIIKQEVNAGRNLQLKWEVQQLIQDSIIMDIINQANTLQMQILSFPQSTLPEQSNISFTLTITNILQQSNQIQFNITTLQSSLPSFNFITTKTQYYSWIPIQIQINYDNSICQNKKIIQWTNPVQITFSEIQAQRSPQYSKQLNFEQSVIQSQYSQDYITATIPARTLSVNSNYTIQGQFQDLINGNIITQVLNIQIVKSPLIVQIDGGTRIQHYRQSFQLIAMAKDPDENFDWNQDPDISYQIKCIDIQKQGQSCQDINGKNIHLNQTYFQQLQANIFLPYSVIQFIATCQKGIYQTTIQSIIIFLDQDIPKLNVSYPIGYLQRDININERLYFQIEQDQNDNSLADYSYGLIYNYQTVYVSQIPDRYLQFSIWDAFIAFNQITELTIRIQAHKLIDFMPQTFMIKLNVNLPPINTEITIQPQYGNAYFTIFNITALKSQDKDLPLQYRFSYYQSDELMQQDLRNNKINNLITVQDFQNTQQYSGILESGDLKFIISIKDNYGSIVNYTQDIKILSFYEQIQKTQNDTIYCQDFLTQLVYKNIEQWIILSQELFKLYNSNVSNHCQQSIYIVLQGLSYKLIQYQDQTSNKNTLNRIFISLQQFYSLEYQNKGRLIQESQICINENSQFVNFNKSNFENKSDSEQLQLILHSLSTQVSQTVKDSIAYYNGIQDSLNSGDDSAQRNYLYNINQRENLILLLGSVYGLAYPSRIDISLLINQLVLSFQNQLQLDSLPIRLITKNVGVQIMKLGQTNFLKYIILDPSYQDQINFNLEIFVSIIRYSRNAFLYTQNFSKQFNNMTYIYYQDIKQDNQTKTQRLVEIISLTDTPMFVPYLTTQVNKNFIQMKQLHGFFIAFNTEYYIKNCKQDNNISQFVCVSYINDFWQMGYCQINYIAINSTVNEIQCICSYLSPITIMIMSNQTIITPIEQKPDQFFIYHATIEFIYNKILLMVMIAIFLLFLIFIKLSKLIFTPKDINQLHNQSYDIILDILTLAPRMSYKQYKENLIYLHQFTKIYMLENRQIQKIQKILLCYLNFTFLATLMYLFDFVLQFRIVNLFVSIFSQLILQIITKILEGFFTGHKILSIIGYFITITLILGQLVIIAFIQGNKSQEWELTILYILGLIVVNTIQEPIIQYLRLHFMHQIHPIIRENKLDPQIHFIYYFLQDEYILYLVQQRQQQI